MAPLIPVQKEFSFELRKSPLDLKVQRVIPRTASDFITTQAGGSGTNKKDHGFLSYSAVSAGAGITQDQFYIGAVLLKDFTLGNDLHIKNSQNKRAVIVHLDGPTMVVS